MGLINLFITQLVFYTTVDYNPICIGHIEIIIIRGYS